MLLNQTDVAVDVDLEKIIITIYNSTETDIGNNESGYEYSSGETTETSSETEACQKIKNTDIYNSIICKAKF